MRSSFDCVLCCSRFNDPASPEHILLKALGGRLTTRVLVCSDCNNRLGSGADQDLADNTHQLRVVCNLPNADGSPPGECRVKVDDNTTMTLRAGADPVLRKKDRRKVSFEEDGRVKIFLSAYNEKDAEQLVESAARQIAKRIGKTSNQAIETIRKDILKERHSSLMRYPKAQLNISLSEGRALQSMAKSCLVLWARKAGADKVCRPRYDQIRNYTNGRLDDEAFVRLGLMDMREAHWGIKPLPRNAFGGHPNMIYAGCDDRGRVFGYFRLYDAIGFRFLLAEAPQTITPGGHQSCMLLSDPYVPENWALLHDGIARQNWSRISSDWPFVQSDYKNPVTVFSRMIDKAQSADRDRYSRRLVGDALEMSGAQMGETLSKEQAEFIARYISERIAVMISGRQSRT